MEVHAILSGTDRSARAKFIRAAANIASPAYGLAVVGRNFLFDAGLRRPRYLGRPTFSVGNLTTGGTGKTPLVAAIARRLLNGGHRPAILMRGYRSANQGSDEAMVYRDELGSAVPIGVNPNRAAAASDLLARDAAIDRFILDDGFQHRQVHRDLNIVLIDATCPFGFDRLLPRGLLREPVKNLRRADAVVVTRSDQVGLDVLADLDRRIELLHGRPVAAHAIHAWTGCLGPGDVELTLGGLATLRVALVCGIGNPQAFQQTAAGHIPGLLPDATFFGDHHHCERDELRDLLKALKERGAQAVLTTSKDWVKWRTVLPPEEMSLPVYRPVLNIQFREGQAALDALLASVAS